MENWQIKITEIQGRFGKALFIFRKSHDGRLEVLLPNGKTMVSDWGMAAEPTLFLDMDIFQSLVNAIHEDFKPSEGKYTEGKLKATEYHLEDLRKLLKLK